LRKFAAFLWVGNRCEISDPVSKCLLEIGSGCPIHADNALDVNQ
jgi:hypothetical protein